MKTAEYTGREQRILFWPTRPGLLREYVHRKVQSTVLRSVLEPLADAAESAIHQMAQYETGQPLEFVRTDIADADRAELAKALAAGARGMGYMGYAECRICAARLGTHDLFGFGFLWPERAEHYITEHNVWTPGCDRLLAAIRGAA